MLERFSIFPFKIEQAKVFFIFFPLCQDHSFVSLHFKGAPAKLLHGLKVSSDMIASYQNKIHRYINNEEWKMSNRIRQGQRYTATLGTASPASYDDVSTKHSSRISPTSHSKYSPLQMKTISQSIVRRC